MKINLSDTIHVSLIVWFYNVDCNIIAHIFHILFKEEKAFTKKTEKWGWYITKLTTYYRREILVTSIEVLTSLLTYLMNVSIY